jgi:hypothetical protein
VQTFLPYADYLKSARHLDNKRLGKQRLECKQILLALGVPMGPHTPGNSGWARHPAVCMWRGYELSLAVYGMCMCIEWRKRKFKDTLSAEFIAAYRQLRKVPALIKDSRAKKPAWLGNTTIHASHRSNLLRKDFNYYSKFGWTERPDMPYAWPVA